MFNNSKQSALALYIDIYIYLYKSVPEISLNLLARNAVVMIEETCVVGAYDGYIVSYS